MQFTITIPSYKTQYLRECIDSVLGQTYEDFEVIILNDASPEDVGGIVHSYTDTRIRYFENEKNVGAVDLVDNWNKCLELAKGNYIICIGDDDMLMPDCLEQYAEMIVKYPHVDLLHARTFRINEESKPIAVSQGYSEHEHVFQFMLHRLNYGIQFIGDFCYRTETLRKMGGYFKLPLAWGTDDITAYMSAKEQGVVNIQKPTFCYRTNQDSITNGGYIPLKLEAVDKMLSWYRAFIVNTKTVDTTDELCKK
jgi:glycosyltransferase involved in cell wall biosynthesis